MATNLDTEIHIVSTADDLEFMAAFKQAIQDPEQRKQIISILETAGLLPSAVRWPA